MQTIATAKPRSAMLTEAAVSQTAANFPSASLVLQLNDAVGQTVITDLFGATITSTIELQEGVAAWARNFNISSNSTVVGWAPPATTGCLIGITVGTLAAPGVIFGNSSAGAALKMGTSDYLENGVAVGNLAWTQTGTGVRIVAVDVTNSLIYSYEYNGTTYDARGAALTAPAFPAMQANITSLSAIINSFYAALLRLDVKPDDGSFRDFATWLYDACITRGDKVLPVSLLHKS